MVNWSWVSWCGPEARASPLSSLHSLRCMDVSLLQLPCPTGLTSHRSRSPLHASSHSLHHLGPFAFATLCSSCIASSKQPDASASSFWALFSFQGQAALSLSLSRSLSLVCSVSLFFSLRSLLLMTLQGVVRQRCLARRRERETSSGSFEACSV